VDIRRFPWVKRLATDYAFDHGRLASFFAGHPSDPAAWPQAIERAQRHPRQRDALTSLVQDQQRRRGAPVEAIAAARQLRDPRAVAVVTGQQAGLFGGPLFTLFKALTAVRLAEHVHRTYDVPAIAVFWIDAEDHDWHEVRQCGVLDADLTPHAVTLGDPPGAHTAAVAQVRLDESAADAVTALARLLPQTDFTADLLAGLRHAYQPGSGMADAFGRWLDTLLGARGLVVFDSSDPAAKPIVADLFAREIERADTSRLAAEAGAALQSQGYHAQVEPADGSLALFHLGTGREPIRLNADGTCTVGTREVSRAALLQQVRDTPAAFSPGVLLRPLVQDTLFPTVCYVSGPSELAYLAQLRSVYDAFAVPMPLVHERATATLLDANAMRFLTRHGMPFEALRPRDESALNDVLRTQLPASVDTALEQATRTVTERMEALAASLTGLDPTLEGAARSTLSRMQDDLKRLQGKIIQAAKRKDDTLRRQFRHAQAQAFPGGEPQERQIGSVYFLNRYGPALIDRVIETLPAPIGTHYVMAM
jgi:bacillithiol biosynthesis cysteine-adding enzyme BshC